MKIDLLVGLASYQKKIEEKTENAEFSKNMLKATHFSLQMWSEAKKKRAEAGPTVDGQYLDYLDNYSIGNIVEIVAIQHDKGEVGFMSMKEKGSKEFDR